MGLGGLVAMSDRDAMSVRGRGFMGGGSSVQVFGNSVATIITPKGSAHSENGYVASGRHFAKGANGSHAGVVKKHGVKFGRGGFKSFKSTVVFAGGFSFGVAH
jgi:hypothetical protein